MSESTEELAARLEAEDKLRRRGMEKKMCKTCNGMGEINGCAACDNRGYKWQLKFPNELLR